MSEAMVGSSTAGFRRPAAGGSGLLRLRVGRLVDGAGAAPIADGALLVAGERIAAVGPAAAVPTPDGATCLEFPDLTLVPGLVDCHSHLNCPGDGTDIDVAAEGDDLLLLRAAENARLALQTGVTTLRDNGASGRTAFSLKEAVRRGIVPAPRLSVCGRALTITGGHWWPFGGEADGVEGVRLAVRQLIKEGADWIKVMTTGGSTRNTNWYRPSYSPAELRAAVEEASGAGRLAAAHALGTAGIRNALDAGFDMIVHGYFHDADGRYAFNADLARRVADQGVWVNPTMHVVRTRIRRWERLAEDRPLNAAEMAALQRERRTFAERCDNLQRLLAAGARLVAGSDAGSSYAPFGAFHDEVEAMAAAGMGAAAALRAATLDSALAMGVGGDVGSLEPGKLADLLLVEGDPTVDVNALGRVAAIFLGGVRIR
ncbi:MAG: amidohydrolase family protein [Chloroflexi bacterium]|nr:amidohydrolase family protein [Chloroflexota bacterium]